MLSGFLFYSAIGIPVEFKDGRFWVSDQRGARMIGIGSLKFNFAGGVTLTPESMKKESDGSFLLEYRSGSNPQIHLSGTILSSGDSMCVTFVLNTPEKFNVGGAMLNLQLSRGIQKGNVEKYGIWNRCAVNPFGESYETFGVKLKRISGKNGVFYLELPGNENWSGAQSEHLSFKKIAPGKYEAGFSLYFADSGGQGFEIAAKHSKQPFGIRLFTQKRNNLWESGPIELKFAVSNVSGSERENVPVSIVVRDYDGKTVVDWKKTESFRVGERKCFTIQIPGSERNLYFAEGAVGNANGPEIFTRTNAAVLPPHEFKFREKSIFGINARMGRVFRDEQEQEVALLKRMGVRQLRGGDNRLTKKAGIESIWHMQCPKEPYNPKNPKHVAQVKRWIDGLLAAQCTIYEFGNEIGHRGTKEERHKLYDAYLSWLNALRAERERRNASFKIIYGTSAFRPELMRLIEEKGIFKLLDGFVVHPGRGYFTADEAAGGWKYLGIVQKSKKIYADYGHADKPIYLTEVYVKTKPNDGWADSYRQSGENALLTAALALAEGMAGFHLYQLHEGISFDENGIDPSNMEYHYGLLHRDNSPKPSFMGYVTAAEELDGAKFLRYVKSADKKKKLRGMEFETPHGKLAILYDRSEGTMQMKHGAFPRKKNEKFFHYEPWLDHWRVRKSHTFKTTRPVVTVVDVLGRRTEIPSENNSVTLSLSGAPVLVYGIQLQGVSEN